MGGFPIIFVGGSKYIVRSEYVSPMCVFFSPRTTQQYVSTEESPSSRPGCTSSTAGRGSWRTTTFTTTTTPASSSRPPPHDYVRRSERPCATRSHGERFFSLRCQMFGWVLMLDGSLLSDFYTPITPQMYAGPSIHT